ncbi:MAG: MFS transporter [Armatimonas sp.]
MTTWRHWRIRIFTITWLAYAGFYLTRKSFSVVKSVLKEQLGISKPQLAFIDTAYNIAYAFGMMGFGVLGDRLGTRRVILAGMFVSILAGLAMGFSHTVLIFGVLMTIQGLVQSTGWGPLARNLSQFFGTKERGLIMGLWCTNYSLGGVIATALAGKAAEKFGWPAAFWVPALTLFGIWVLFIVLQRDRPEDVGLPPIDSVGEEGAAAVDTAKDAPPTPPEQSSWADVQAVLKNPMVQLLSGVYFAVKPIRYLFLLWGPLYIHERLGTGVAESALLSTTFEVGGPIGALRRGWISDKFLGARRVPVCVVSLAVVAICVGGFGSLPASKVTIGCVLAVLGAFLYAADSLVTGTAAVDFGTRKGAATAAGVINGFGSFGQILGGLLPGLVGDTPADWNPLFWALAIGVAIAALAMIPKWNAVPSK